MLEVIKSIMSEVEEDAFFLTSEANMNYMSGFTGEGYVYLSENRSMVVTDFRYEIATKKECEGFDIVLPKPGHFYDPLIQALQEDQVKVLGYEMEHVTMEVFNKICALFQAEAEGEFDFQNVDDFLRDLRMVKSEEEIECIRKAEAIGDKAFEAILDKIKPGITEKEVAAWLEFFMKQYGADGLSFDTIAASGIHSAMPHAVPTDKVLEEGDFLTMDFGCKVKGYCSDMTRTVVIGKASDKQKEIYNIVKQAQEAAIAAIRPGMMGKEVDAIARNIIKEAGYGECFGHSLGHSVGLEIHEQPNFSSREETIIEPGMVITVEPGIYVEDFGGVRIEDLVCITEDGCENLTHSNKDLIEIGVEYNNE